MKLEEQVCSLELAQKLKELGVKQDAYWLWTTNTGRAELTDDASGFESEQFSAFTVAELGEMLLNHDARDVEITLYGYNRGYIRYEEGDAEYQFSSTPNQDYTSFADAMAKMLVYLIENKLIKLAPKQEEGK